MGNNYGVENIEHLETREAMRTRIQMYLGSDDTEGIYQALKEIINNSTDEALAGYGDKICILLDEATTTVTVRDFGRGVPFGIKDGRNILVAIYTESHTGGKFDKNAYKNSSGLNGIGGTAVCMSSSKFLVKSERDGKAAMAVFEQGILKDYKEVEYTGTTTGTTVTFRPDEEVFANAAEGFSYDRICEEIKNISYLNKGIRFIIETTSGKKQEYYSENGIADFIADNVKDPLMNAPIIVSKKDETDEIEIAFMWTGGNERSYVFVNGLFCPQGGAPITGAKTAITNGIKKLSGQSFDPDLIRKGLVYAINCKVANPSFEGQTKSKINNTNLRTLASAAFKEGLEDFSHTPDFSAIIEMMKRFQKAEKAADKATDNTAEAGIQTSTDKGTDKNPENEDTKGHTSGKTKSANVFAVPAYRAVMAMAFLIGLIFYAMLSNMTVEAGDIGLPAVQIGFVSTVIFTVNVLTQLPVGMACDRFGSIKILTVSFAAYIAALLFLAFGRLDFAGLCVVAGIAGYGKTVMNNLTAFLVQEFVPQEDKEQVLSLCVALMTAGLAAGMYSVQLIYDLAGGYQPAYLLYVLISIGAVALLHRLRRQKIEVS